MRYELAVGAFVAFVSIPVISVILSISSLPSHRTPQLAVSVPDGVVGKIHIKCGVKNATRNGMGLDSRGYGETRACPTSRVTLILTRGDIQDGKPHRVETLSSHQVTIIRNTYGSPISVEAEIKKL